MPTSSRRAPDEKFRDVRSVQNRSPFDRHRRTADVLDLQTSSTVLRMQVLVGGQRIAVRDAQSAAEFEMYAYADYVRLNEERRGILNDIKDRGTVYG